MLPQGTCGVNILLTPPSRGRGLRKVNLRHTHADVTPSVIYIIIMIVLKKTNQTQLQNVQVVFLVYMQSFPRIYTRKAIDRDPGARVSCICNCMTSQGWQWTVCVCIVQEIDVRVCCCVRCLVSARARHCVGLCSCSQVLCFVWCVGFPALRVLFWWSSGIIVDDHHIW